MASNIKVDVVRPTATNGSLSLKGDSGGSATTNGVTVNSSGNTAITGTTTISSLVATTADINGGTIDATTIATSDITVGSGKTLDVSAGTLTLANDQISGDKVEGGTIAATTITTLTSTTIKATTGQSLTLKDEDGNAAITIGTDNTAAGYLGLNFGSYHGDSGGAGSGTLSANTLDDYEQGTWTPTINGTGGTPSYGTRTGSYVKIGSFVYCEGYVSLSVTPSGSTIITISGLPFNTNSTANRNRAGSVFPAVGFGGSWDMICLDLGSNSATIALYRSSASTGNNLASFTAANMGSVLNLRFAISYHV